MCSFNSFPGIHMEKTLLPRSGNFDMICLSDSTRKRKLTTDQHDFSGELNLINDHGNSLPQSVDSVSFSSTSENLGRLLVLDQNNVSRNGHGGNSHEKLFPWEQNGSNATKINDGMTVGATLSVTSTCIEQNENNRPLMNDVQSGSGSLATRFRDNARVNDRGQGVGGVPIMKKTGADMEKSRHSLEEMISHKNDNSSANVVVKDGNINERNGISVGSSESTDDKSKSHAGKLAPIVAENLWDGSLQLNSSITVSAIASFKSGEKMPACKWPNFIEVKGKVRLEAFEKYIQDLSRSRNRGLMVISLQCKGGSSKSGLAGMKEVAKGYKKGERVGLAQLCQGIDLYVCPHSDSIITVLAKHGFFKGMTAVEDNRDSLIGCVVWRRNRTSANSVVKKSERKKHSLAEQPLNSAADSSSQRVDEKDFPLTKPARESIRVESRTDCKILGSPGNDNAECKHIETSQVQPELLKSSATASLLLISPVLSSNSSSMSNGHQVPSTTDTPNFSTIVGRTLQIEAPLMSSSQEKPKPALEIHRPVLKLPSDTVKGPFPAPDDDDLPEFDFGAACGISPASGSKLLDAATIDKKLPAENFMKINRTLLSMVPNMQSMPASNQRGHGDFGLGRLPHDAVQRMRLQNEVREYDKTLALPNSEEKHAAKTSLPVSTADVLQSKNLFDDDDDMPEWCPPNAKLHRQVVPETEFNRLGNGVFPTGNQSCSS
ncbi:uncharacterized protein LOC110660055 isoform X2 [Hevea brasiliensis]|uniref:uncharacterized protein LOC110660055 isoform X2 n=1 Tax=Hevea brasiliensis TaxID=3981 RepID=UPI0025DBE27B|nr:uncharacterized protein LOC110660055 isoform X2 [Hevea brasiliensis]